MLGMRDTITELECRINEPDHYAAAGKLTRGILNQAGAQSPMALPAETFNQAAEKYYRTEQRDQHIEESFNFLSEDILKLNRATSSVSQEMRSLLHNTLGENDLPSFLKRVQSEVMQKTASPTTLEKIVHLILAYIYYKKNSYLKFQESQQGKMNYEENAR
jgi:hypothetical protein